MPVALILTVSIGLATCEASAITLAHQWQITLTVAEFPLGLARKVPNYKLLQGTVLACVMTTPILGG